MSEIHIWSATALARAIRAKKLSALEALDREARP